MLMLLCKIVENCCFLLICFTTFPPGHTVVFADQSGINASGHVMLGTMDVHHQWTKVMQLQCSCCHIFSVFLCVFWPLCLCASSFLSSCPAIAACSSRQSGWRKGSAFCWVELKWSIWRGLDQSSPLLSTTPPSAPSTRLWCPNAFVCTPGAYRGSSCCWRSMLSWNTMHTALNFNQDIMRILCQLQWPL